MATIYKCDRCYKEYTKRDDITLLEVEWGSSYLGMQKIKKDLCSPCLNLLHDWVKPLPREASKLNE